MIETDEFVKKLYTANTFEELKLLSPYKEEHLLWKVTDRLHRYMSAYEAEHSSTNQEDNWNYYINDWLFRENWNCNTPKKVGFFGCSVTFGIGVPSELTFVKQVESYYGSENYECINLGTPGAGIQRISKIVRTSSKIFNFDAAIVTLPTPTRFLSHSGHRGLIDFSPAFIPEECKKEYKNIYVGLHNNDFVSLMFDYIDLISLIFEKQNIPVLWGTWDDHTQRILEISKPPESILPMIIHHPSVGFARDGGHPGPAAHKAYANSIIERLNNLQI